MNWFRRAFFVGGPPHPRPQLRLEVSPDERISSPYIQKRERHKGFFCGNITISNNILDMWVYNSCWSRAGLKSD
jgi:hypothetical protein